MKEYILCSAVYYETEDDPLHQPKNIERGIVVSGRRHHNCFMTTFRLDPTLKTRATKIIQGFITNTDRFVDRIEAGQIAIKSKQIKEITRSNQLYSEDLY